jgi:hypothetical protein
LNLNCRIKISLKYPCLGRGNTLVRIAIFHHAGNTILSKQDLGVLKLVYKGAEKVKDTKRPGRD